MDFGHTTAPSEGGWARTRRGDPLTALQCHWQLPDAPKAPAADPKAGAVSHQKQSISFRNGFLTPPQRL